MAKGTFPHRRPNYFKNKKNKVYKTYLEDLKKNDPIHYCEIMGYPVTGLRTDNNSNLGVFIIVISLIAIGFAIGVSI